MEGYINYFELCKNKYNDIKTIIEDIEYYEYSDYAMYSILPCYFNRGFVTKGKKLESNTGLYVYGFDDKKHLTYVKYGSEEKFLLYKDYEITLYCYGKSLESSEIELLYIQKVKLDDNGLPLEAIEVNLWECVMRETYEYRNDKLIAIYDPINFRYGLGKDVLKINYNKDGKVSEIYDDNSILPMNLVYKYIEEEDANKIRTEVTKQIVENIIKDIINKSQYFNGSEAYIEIQVKEEPHTILSDVCVVIGTEEDIEEMLDIYDEVLRCKCNVLVQHYMSKSYSYCYEECQKIISAIRERIINYDWINKLENLKKIEVKDVLYYD